MRRVKLVLLAGSARERLLYLGTWRQLAPCDLRLGTGKLGLAQAILAEVGLAPGIPANVRVYDDGDAVRIGPLVGVLLGNGALGLLHGRRSAPFRAMVRAARAVGAVPLFFLPQDVDLAEGRVAAWTERRGRWEQLIMPLPDVVYNQAITPTPEERAAVDGCLRDLSRQYGVIALNAVNSISSAQLYEALAGSPETAALVPPAEADALGAVVHLRVIAQKDRRAVWRFPAVLVREGRPSPHAFHLPELSTEVGRRVVTLLEPRFGWLGELGVDMGVDRAGRPWVLEVHTRPTALSVRRSQARLARYPFQFATYLASQRWDRLHAGLQVCL